MKRTISRFFFERFSGYYDWLLAADFQVELRREFLSFMREKNGASLIEFGCGPGNFLCLAAPLFDSVTGIDASHSMIVRAQRRLENCSPVNAELIQVEADNFSSKRRFSHAAGVSFLYLVENKERVIQRMISSILPGGSLALMEPSDRFNSMTAAHCCHEHRFDIRDRFSLRNWLKSVRFHNGLSKEKLKELFSAHDLTDIEMRPALSGLVLFARGTRRI